MFDVVDFEMMMILNSEYLTLISESMNILPSLLRAILFSKFMNILFNPDVILFLKGITLLSKSEHHFRSKRLAGSLPPCL